MLDLLQGVRVVSFNHFLLGPVGIQALGDLGADVIAVEATEGAWQRHWSGANKWADGQSMLLLVGNRNKRSVALDLKSDRGKEIALKLCRTADVVSENFRPGVMERFGLIPALQGSRTDINASLKESGGRSGTAAPRA